MESEVHQDHQTSRRRHQLKNHQEKDMSNLDKPVQKSIGESDWKSLLVQIWQSDKTRPDEHYLKSSTVDWDAPLQKHLRVGYKR